MKWRQTRLVRAFVNSLVRLLPPWILAFGWIVPALGQNLPALTSAQQVRRLTVDEANRGYPVHLRAVVTYFVAHNPELLPGERYTKLPPPDMFVEDATAGIFVNVPPGAPSAEAGQLVEMDGVTEAPDFAPQIGQATWRVIGQASLPEPRRVPFERLASTAEDSQFVEILGVVRTAEQQGDQIMLDIAVSGGRLRAIIPQLRQAALMTLPDSEVRIRGVCGALFNEKNQLIGVLIYVAGLDQVDIIRPGFADPFQAAIQPISSTQRFAPEAVSGHRIHVRGTVSFQQPGSFLYIVDGVTGLRVETTQSSIFKSGDVVDVVGFPNLVNFRPVLEDSTVRLHAHGQPPWPLPMTVKQLFTGDYDSALVAVEGRLLQKSLVPGNQMLLLEAGGLTINASMGAPRPDKALRSLEPGSLLRITGICETQKDRNGHNQSSRLLFDESADVAVVARPSWWTLRHVFGIVAALLLTMAGAGAWVVVLRRRVKLQTAVIVERYAREATLEENYRKLFAHHPHPMWVYDTETLRFLAVNEAAESRYGYSSEEFLGMTIVQIRPPEEISRLMQDLSENSSGLVDSGTWTHRKKDGSLIEAEVVAHELAFAGRNARLVVAVDVTEREKTKRIDRDRQDIVESIAQHQGLDQVTGKLIAMVEKQAPEFVISAALLNGGKWQWLAAHLPENIIQATNGIPGADAGGPEWPSESDPFWSAVREASLREGYATCWRTPICAGSGQVLGLLIACARHSRTAHAADQQVIAMAAQLASVAVEQGQLHQRLLFQAHHDILTGLPNRILLDDRLMQCLARGRRNGTSVAVLQIDLDGFKLINDCLGHANGDAVLQAVAQRLRACVRESDTLARVGGDEFTLIVPDLTHTEAAHRIAEELLANLRQPFDVQGTEVFVSASVGIAFYPHHATDTCSLLKKADAAMYRAKTTGKNQWQAFTSEAADTGNRLELENGLRHALERNELELFYQPIFDVSNGSLATMEALLRWRHPRLGMVSPGQFIPIAEESGLIVPIGRWVMEQACRHALGWQPSGKGTCKVSVNVSAVQFARGDIVQVVSSILAETGLEPFRLELELTESLVMQNLELSARQLTELRALGVSVAVDDFGTGYSALSYLQQLPVDYIKIDQSFVRQMSEKNPSRLVQAIVRMAHGLGLKVTAEGVETKTQMDGLTRFGCDQVQGYFLGRPMPLTEALALAQTCCESNPVELAS